MPAPPAHGKRLSAEEYERRIVALYTGLAPEPTRDQERQIRRQELDLTIDHRLGTDFPLQRRAALWGIQERVDRRRSWLVFRHMLGKVFPGTLERGSNRLAGFLRSEYSKVLDEEELEAFFTDGGSDPSGR